LFGLLLVTPIGRVSASTEWNLKITNLAGAAVNYSYDQLLAMPISNVSAAIYCFGNPVTFGVWGGVSLSYLLQQVGVDPAVASIDFLAKDGYTASIPLQVAMQPDVIVAYELDGSPLPQTLRLVLPGENGAMWIAVITSITMDASVIDLN
jgi:DMSO/TMAO reductase YedYZ molybdopterin-dependent catalytic subunit